MQTRMKVSDLQVGATYMASLQQDWCTCVLKKIGTDYNPNEVLVDYFGELWCYGVPMHACYIELDHFLLAFEYAPPGDWSRMYSNNKYNDNLGYPAG